MISTADQLIYKVKNSGKIGWNGSMATSGWGGGTPTRQYAVSHRRTRLRTTPDILPVTSSTGRYSGRKISTANSDPDVIPDLLRAAHSWTIRHGQFPMPEPAYWRTVYSSCSLQSILPRRVNYASIMVPSCGRAGGVSPDDWSGRPIRSAMSSLPRVTYWTWIHP